MKNLNRLLVLVCMLFSASVWAQLTEHINLIYNATDKALYLEQDFECEPGNSTVMAGLGLSYTGTCVESIAEGTESDKTPNAIIAGLLKKYWKKENVDQSKSESSTLKLASDIKFGQTLNTSGAEWSCSENSQAFDFSGLVFDGNDFQISQVCNVAYAGAWDAEMGLFHRISGGTVKNLKLSDVDFIILNIPSKGTSISDDEKDYYPVGGLAGIIENGSVVDHISLGYINVSAPFAGGLAGYVDNSAISNISMIGSVASTSKIIVTNDIVLTGNKKDSKMGGYKTLLGGLAGAAYSSEFNDIDVNIDKIECEKGTSQIESSALGGIAGLFVYAEYGKPARNMEITNIVVSNAGIEKVEIKGGSTMGGLFGETRRINSTPSSAPNLSDLVINNVAVKKLEMENSAVSSSSGTPNIYMGGLIGNSGLCNGGVLKIANSVTTEFLISEDITIPGTYQYYVGGIAGYAGCENTSNAGNRNDQYLTLRNSHASGEIWIKGGYSAKKTGNFFVSASVGGLVGTAMLASEKPLTSDTSSVNILYEAKSTPASSTEPDVPSVTIGGIVGAASLYNTSGIPLELEHIIARGVSSGSTSSNVSVSDDGFSASVGGIIGEFPHIDNSGNSSISFADVTASGFSGSLLTYGGTGNGSVKTQTFMGGICGKCKAVRSLNRVSVSGTIYKKTSGVASTGLVGKQFYVGGLVGSSQLTSWPVKVNNTYSFGKISDFNGTSSGEFAVSGYLFGLLGGDGVTKSNEFVANYHMGDDEIAAIGKFGKDESVHENVFDLSKVSGAGLVGKASVNVRNSKGSVKPVLSENKNGAMEEEKMKEQTFVEALNDAWPEKSEQRIWIRSTQTDHNPVFGDLLAVYFLDLDDHVYETKWTKKGGSVSIPSKNPAATKNGRCFDKWIMEEGDEVTNVNTSMTVEPESKTCEYPVTFHYFAADGKTYVDKEQKVLHGEDAVAPDDISKKYEGRCFVGWDTDFTNVTGELNVTAQYLKCEYPVTFHYFAADGKTYVDKEQKVVHGEDAVAPDDISKKYEGRCFVGWDTDFTNVTGELNVTAQYLKCEYTVTFVGINGESIKTDKVVHGTAATPPDDVPPYDGLCFVAWKKERDRDYTNVTGNMNVLPDTKTCTYEVAFYDMDGDLIDNLLTEDGVLLDNPQIVEYGKAAITPRGALRTEDGRCFDYWDEDYSNVTRDIHVSAISKICEYNVTFVYEGADGSKKEKTETVKHGYSASAPDKVPEKVDGQCFVDWKGDFTSVTGPMTIEAEYKTCTYRVTFVDDEGFMLKEDHDVEHGKSASLPDKIEPKDGKCHVGWESESGNDFTHVTNDMVVKAIYGDCKTSSSSVAPASSSDGVVKSSSSTATNKSSSSKVKSGSSTSKSKSSSSKSKSSTSTSYLYEIAQPTVQQDGLALRMEFESASAKSTDKVNYHIQVVSDAGVYLDTVVDGKFVDKAKNGTWRLDPAPAGEYSVNFTLTDGLDSVSYEKVFSTPKEKSLKTNSWQTLSMYALCYNKGEECRYELEERIASEDGSWAVEECEHMKQEIAHGMAPDDDWFRENMEEVCRSAYASQGATTSVYWWDESNPVGEFWQYRKFSSKDKFDSTRGYWYGPMYNEPLELNLQTPDMAAEIVWKLYNRHSGWNLMANPYGWYVKLPQREDVVFWHWDSETGGYEHPEVLGPYEAVWVYAPSTMTLRIPLRASIVLENENKGLAKSASDENWNLRVVLSDNNGKRDAWNELAAGRSEKSLSEPPAGMGDHVDLSIVEGKQRLAKSVKKNGDDLEWNLEASATTSRRGHLSFVGLERVWAKGLRVYATIGDETIEVVDDKSIDVQLSSKAKNVSVHVTKGGVPAKIAKNWLSGFRVNQMSNVLNVGFDAAAKLAGANVKVSIVGVDGRIVSTKKSVASEGSNVVSMKKPKQGVYFVRAQVGSLSATSRIMVR